MEKRISGTTTLLGLIGSPVGHSGSPAMHNYSFQRLGIDCAYMAFDISCAQWQMKMLWMIFSDLPQHLFVHCLWMNQRI